MRTTSALALAFTLALPLSAADDPVDLKWSLKEGDTFYVKNVQKMDMTIGVLGNSQDVKQTGTTVVRMKVKSATPGATVVEMTYVDFQIESTAPGAGAVGEKLKGLSLVATLNDKLKVTKLEGYDKFLDALSGGDANQKAVMKLMLGEDVVKQMFSQAFIAVPGKPVGVGDTWADSDKLSMGPLGNFQLKQTFKLEGVTDGMAKIGSKVELTYKPGEGGAGGLPFKITKADMKADKYTATYTFDIRAGRLKGASADAIISGTMTASANGQEIEITMKMKMKQTTEVTDKNPVVD
ncbi:MAG: hypothetical protein JWO38_7765 [Gemmataceae bacterium]|nr:hypothetical protein [Gemmataceae bacterium]